MSHGVHPYAFRVASLRHYHGYETRQVTGTRVPPLAPEKLLRRPAVKRELARLDVALGGTPMLEIARDYYRAETRFPDEGHKYWYWVEILCGRGRGGLTNTEWMPSSAAPSVLSGPPFVDATLESPWPRPHDFPHVICVPWAELDAALQHVTAERAADRVSEKALRELEGWVRVAAGQVSDLFLFHY